MDQINNVYELAEKFMRDPQYVKMDEEKIKSISEKINSLPIVIPPPPDKTNDESKIYKPVLLELVAASVNYCYWYGKSTIRPNNINSTFMYECLMNAFFNFHEKYISSYDVCLCIDKFIDLLLTNKFPLIEERINHLNQLKTGARSFVLDLIKGEKDNSIETYMTLMFSKFPGFASDLFLKRASLFFVQLYRRFGWFANDLHHLFVPADYQVPKMLEHYKCLVYNSTLKSMIKNNELIPKNSLMECEIRSATILTIKKICKLTGLNVSDIDGYFFFNRHLVTKNFHLCITTDY